MIDLAMFRNPVLTVSVVSGYLVYGALSGVFFLLPFYLEGVLGYDTRQTGWHWVSHHSSWEWWRPSPGPCRTAWAFAASP
jgi:hypothetical protein